MQRRTVCHGLGLCLTVVAACALVGCQAENTSPVQPTPRPAAAQEELCAAHMHELSGLLLQHYLVHQRLPDTAEALTDLAGSDALKCPVTGTDYLYFPEGLRAPDQPRWLVLVDADRPSAGHRSAIVISEPQGTQPLGMWVVNLSDKQLSQYMRK